MNYFTNITETAKNNRNVAWTKAARFNKLVSLAELYCRIPLSPDLL